MTLSTETTTALQLHGVDHTARPTWRLGETVAFYRDTMGLPLVHAISARGWGTDAHPDFLHIFFDSGQGSTIAFFYYLGSQLPADMADRPGRRPAPDDHVFDATHTAWLVPTEEELHAWHAKLEAAGVTVSVATRHEMVESIYFRDPNGYLLEITRKLRPLGQLDAGDAARTIEAALQAERQERRPGQQPGIDEVWQLKGRMLAGSGEPQEGIVRVMVLDVPEFASMVESARRMPSCRVVLESSGYWSITAGKAIEFQRRELGMKPAVWYGMFTSGFEGRMECFDRERVRIVPEH